DMMTRSADKMTPLTAQARSGDAVSDTAGGWGVAETPRRGVGDRGGAPQGGPYAALRLGKTAPPHTSE
ncbi:MAG: hypothetical protein LBK25_03830, partial [Treponema sp.]|nr:hypothetical protein [Treponema sp.]